MRMFTWRFLTLTAILVVLNTIGLVLIARHSSPPATDPSAQPTATPERELAPAAAPADPLRVIAFSPAPEQPAQGADRVVLVFDRPVVAEDEIDQPPAMEPFRIEPALDGRWTWAATDQLAFLPDVPLPSGHRFTVEPTANAVAALGAAIDDDDASFVFDTGALAVQTAFLRSNDDRHATIEVAFTQPVTPAGLAGAVTAHLGASDLTLPVTVLSGEPARRMRVRVERPVHDALVRHVVVRDGLGGSGGETDLDETALAEALAAAETLDTDRIRITVAAGLLAADADPAAELGLAAEFAESVALKSALAFATSEFGHVRQRDRPGGDASLIRAARVRFSRPLAAEADQPEGLLDAIVVEPPLENRRVHIDGTELQVTGTFEPRARYHIEVPQHIKARDGQVLDAPLRTHVDVPGLPSRLRLTASRGVLMPGGNLLLDVETVNTPAMRVVASRVHDNNLVAHLHGASSRHTDRQLPLARETIELAGALDETVAHALDLRALLAGGKDVAPGIYRISVGQPGNRWNGDSAIVTVTDLGLTARRERDGYLVLVTSLSTAEPLAEVTLTARSANNQVVATAVTGEDGTARLLMPEARPDGDAWVLVAARGEDRSYLQPDRRPLVLDQIDQSGRAHPETFDAMLYGDRGAYRPGDTLHLTGIVRDADGGLPPALPMSLEIVRPDGRLVAELPVDVDPARQGIFHTEWTSQDVAQTGRYRLRLFPPGARRGPDGRRLIADAIGASSVLVEAIERVRLEVEAAFTSERVPNGEPIELAGTGRYLFGTPATGLDVAFSGVATPMTITSDRHPEFTFTPPATRDRRRRVPTIEGTVDEDGAFQLDVPRAMLDRAAPGRWRVGGTVGVTEAGGRTVSRWVQTDVDTADRFVGLRWGTPGSTARWHPVGTEVEHAWVALDGEGADAAVDRLELVLERITSELQLLEVRGTMQWRRQRTVEPVETWSFDDASEGRLMMQVNEPGRYRLTARSPVAEDDEGAEAETEAEADPLRVQPVAIEFYAAGSGAQYAALSTELPERLELALDREHYVPGDVAVLSLRSAFAGGGTAFVTVETDRVVSHRVVRFDERDGQLEVPIDADIRGGAFVTVSMTRAIDPGRETWMPHRAAGIIRLPMQHADRRLAVTVDAPERTEPLRSVPVTIDVRTADGATPSPASADAPPPMAHVWAVDEGLLQVTLHETADPHAHFLGARRRDVRASDVFGDLLPDHDRPETVDRIGGDEDASGLRRGLVSRPRVTPAVVWRTAVPVDADGRVRTRIDVPDLQGRLRIMAVVVDGDRYGSADHDLIVASPITVQSSWPRSVVDGDRFTVAVTVFNHTVEDRTLPLDVRIDGPLTVDPAALAEALEVPAGGSARRWVPVTSDGIGPVRVRVLAGAPAVAAGEGSDLGDALGTPERTLGPFGGIARDSATLTVRPAGILETRASLARVAPGETVELDPHVGFVPGTVRWRAQISGDPVVDLLPAAAQAFDYPYGCGEQTISRLAAIIALPDVLDLERDRAIEGDVAVDASISSARAEALRSRVRAGLDRMAAMQTLGGGFAYWPGQRTASPWVTAYATWIMLEAERAGYDVDARVIDMACDRLEGWLIGDRVGLNSYARLTDEIRTLACRALVLAGRPPHSTIGGLEASFERLDIGGRAHLAAALFESGRRDRAMAVLGETMPQVDLEPTTSGRFTSGTAQESLMLEVLVAMDPAHPWVAPMVQRLQERRDGGHWGTTVSNAAAVRALAAYQASRPRPAPLAGIAIEPDGTERELAPSGITRLAGTAAPLRVALAPAEADDEADGGPGSASATVAMVMEGLVPAAMAESRDRRLRVRRIWTGVDGAVIDPASLSVGDVVQVEVQLSLPADAGRSSVGNIAIVDQLPGGLEPENPRLASSGMERGRAPKPSRTQFADDRVLLFATARASTQSYRYTLRATTAGTFMLPPIQASCMYDPQFASVHGAGRVVISP